MAYLIGSHKVYLFVETEETAQAASASSHAVEQGADITDHVKAEPEELTVSGEIVGRQYQSIISTIKSWERSGELLRYAGSQTLRSCIIQSFSPSFSAEVSGGCKFSLSLKRIRIAAPAYVAAADVPREARETVSLGMQSVEVNDNGARYHTVKPGDTIYSLVNGPYRSEGKSCEDIMAANPEAFSKRGDFRTLKVGGRLKMGG